VLYQLTATFSMSQGFAVTHAIPKCNAMLIFTNMLGTEPSKEASNDFKAPLGEQEFVLDWAQSGYHRPIPSELAATTGPKSSDRID
jgi:hypothetical protein